MTKKEEIDRLEQQVDEACKKMCLRMELEENEWYAARARGEPVPEPCLSLDAWLPQLPAIEYGGNTYVSGQFKPIKLPQLQSIDFRPIDFRPLPNGRPVNVCVCDIKNLTSVGHDAGCPERRR